MPTDFDEWKASWERMTRKNAFGAVLSMDRQYTEEEFDTSGAEAWDRLAPFAPAPCSRILDLGCGAGRVLGHARKHCDTAIGFDISEEMLARARQRLGTDGYVYTRDFDTVETGSVDFLYTVGVFKHLTLEMVEGHIANAGRVLRPGGVFYINYYSELPNKFAKGVDETAPGKDDQQPRTNRLIPQARMETMLDRAGFDVVQSKPFRMVGRRRGA